MFKSDKEKFLFESFSSVCKILEEANINYWLSSGTLLGAYRENKIIDDDNDWDIDCLANDIDKIMSCREKFEKLGLHVEYPSYQDGISSTILRGYLKDKNI